MPDVAPTIPAPRPRLLATADIPQANLLPRVVEMVWARMRSHGATEVPGFDHPRDRAFYTRAARILGLLAEDACPTLLGRRVVHATAEVRIGLLRLAFERSEIGQSWMRWVGAGSVAQLCGSTAEAFLGDCTALAPSTVGRRALTLRSWLEQLRGERQ